MIVTAHQPNFLPARSVMAKLAQADAVLWLDWVDFSRNGFTNRNRLPDGTWLTVPVRGGMGKPIAEVEVAHRPRWREKLAATIRQRYSRADYYDDGAASIIEAFQHDKLAALNRQLLAWLVPKLAGPLEARHQAERADDISVWLAQQVASIGGTVYLSGPSGRNYLDPLPFARRGLEVEFFEWANSDNWTALHDLFEAGKLTC